jgi:hypothetical protein
MSWLLEELGWSEEPNSLSFFCSLVSRVTSSAIAYLLAIVNISSNVPESLLEEHGDWFFINLRDGVPLVAKLLNKLTEGLSFLPHHAGKVPFDSWPRACSPEVADELLTWVGPGADRPYREPLEPGPNRCRQTDEQVVFHNVRVPTGGFDGELVHLEPLNWIGGPVIPVYSRRL